MKQTLKSMVALLALLLFAQGIIPGVSAADGEDVSITGVLKVLKKQNGTKTSYLPYIVNGEDTKTFIQFNIANKGQRPNLKKYVKKRITIDGIGRQKIIKDRTYLIFTKVNAINKADAKSVKEPSNEPKVPADDAELKDI